MLKMVIISSVLIATLVAANIDDFENNFIEYEDIPIRGISLPYPYQDNRAKRVMPIEAPTYYRDDFGNTVVVPFVPQRINSVVPKATSVVRKVTTSTGIISSLVSHTFRVSKAAIWFVISNGPALILGSIMALGICKLTPFCNTFSNLTTLHDIQREITSLASPERIARATDFVQKAIKMYESMQDTVE